MVSNYATYIILKKSTFLNRCKCAVLQLNYMCSSNDGIPSNFTSVEVRANSFALNDTETVRCLSEVFGFLEAGDRARVHQDGDESVLVGNGR